MKPWKIASIAIALVTGTAFTTGATTAYLMRPAAGSTGEARMSPLAPASAPEPRVTRAAATSPRVAAPRPVRAATATPAVVRPVPVATAPAVECSASTGDRVWRVAKPGLIAGVVGAGLGAAGGAIADGGRAAGKDALIGGLAGTALGGAYGAYKTKQECGSVLPPRAGLTAPAPATIEAATQTAFGSMDNGR